MANINLSAAKTAKNDEFYTQFHDIQKEIEAYFEYDKDTFRDKIIYCNCDDPFESNFFRYFALNFNRLGLKQLITTSYRPSPIANTQIALFGEDKTTTEPKGRPKATANKLTINEVHDMDGDGAFNLSDIAEQLKANKNNEWTPLEGDGDFRSPECIELLKQSDIVITNPPFSLFREYIKQLFDYDKKFLVIGSIGALSYKEIFPLVKNNEMWLGNGFNNGNAFFATPSAENYGKGIYNPETGLVKFRNCHWYTNIDHGRRHQPLSLMSMADNIKFSNAEYPKYVNYDAIEVSKTMQIPSDYDGAMGVPISFLDKYNPDQFEILGTSLELAKKMSEFAQKGTYQQGGPKFYTDNGDGTYKRKYERVVIKRKNLL